MSTGQLRSRRHQQNVSQKTIEVAVVADKLMVDRHSRDQLLPYILTLMNVVRYAFQSTANLHINRIRGLNALSIIEYLHSEFRCKSL